MEIIRIKEDHVFLQVQREKGSRGFIGSTKDKSSLCYK